MTTQQRSFDDFLDHALLQFAKGVPEFPTHMGLFEAAGQRLPQDRFTDISDRGIQSRQDTLQSLADELEAFPRDELRPAQRLSADILDFYLDNVFERAWVGRAGKDFLRHEYLVRPSVGLQSDLPLFLTDLHPMRHERDALDYIKRLKQIAMVLLEVSLLIVERQEDGILPPRFLISETIEEITKFVAVLPVDNILYLAFARKTEGLEEVSAEQRDSMLATVAEEIAARTYPAYDTLKAALTSQLEVAHDDPGLWRLPDGKAYYEFLLHCATTTTMSAEEVHELGLKKTRELATEIIEGTKGIGYEVQSIADCRRILDQDDQPSTKIADISRQAVVDRVQGLIADIEAQMPRLFHHLPKGKLEVRPIPEFAEANRNQIYHPPSLDGTRPGLFELNVGQLLANDKFEEELPTLIYHEIFPGHHLQFALAMETDDLPMLRRIITFDSYIEGWAKYAETIPSREGINTDPKWRLSRMCRELISTGNLALDTGIHTKEWSMEQATEYLVEETGSSLEFARYLVRRSASVPAQMCSYRIGMFKVEELRERMLTALGSAFDVRDFHDVVLRNGAVPLAILDRLVDEEIETRLQQSM